MYSGTTFRTQSGRVMGVHQKIDRVARRHLAAHIPNGLFFPMMREILHFEGLNGPDGIKRKSPAKDEPWHYIDPSNPRDIDLITMINDHIYNLSVAISSENHERAAFEAAWLAHAIVDGLTPAHHYPLEEKLEELRGEGIETRITTKDKLVIPGTSKRAMVRNNWEYWGAKGVMTTHLAFELGVATTIAPINKFDDDVVNGNDFIRVERAGYEALFLEDVHDIADMKMYEEFSKLGWTRHLANETRNTLIPRIVRSVCLAWYQALLQAKKRQKS